MLHDSKLIWLVSICLLVVGLEFLALADIRLPTTIAIPFFIAIITVIGHETLKHAFQALLKLNFKSINLLMLIAVCGAFYLGKYEEAAIIIVLYTLAEKLEDIGIEKSQAALDSLLEKMPKTAIVKGLESPVDIDKVAVDSIVVIKPAEMIPLDGTVVFGTSYVDESTITGEPIPKDKTIGDTVYAGTLNEHGYLEIQVTKEAKDTTFAKIQELTFQATHNKAHTQQFIETFAQYYTPSILLLAILWLFVGTFVLQYSFNDALLNSLALIVIACPCALVISTPVSIYSAIGNASKQGAVVKGGRFLEAIGNIKAIALDKTRTLTRGIPEVSDIVAFGDITREHLLACAAGIEAYSEHPLARGIEAAAKREGIALHPIENFQSVVGKGATADCLVCQDVPHCIGKLSFILEKHTVPQEVVATVDRLQQEGKTSIVVTTPQTVEGVIALTDTLRSSSRALVDGVKALDIHPVMLTGDHSVPANIVAQELGIDDVRASLLPADKAHAIRDLIDVYGPVAMVGDGVNDAPALALANVGISIASLGSDTALEAASIVILNDRLDLIPYLVKLSRKTVGTIQWNTAFAIAVKVIFVALALVNMSNLALAIFADVGVTLIVILTSLRLMHWQPTTIT
jgi:Cd2+/Zn2+-exporting ATPase